jgi:NitT/TauT family transport system substrate-binding protein
MIMRINLKYSLLGLVTLALLLLGCSSADRDPRSIQLSMGFIPNIQYAPFYVAAEKGYFEDAGIEVDFDYSLETDGVTLVGSGDRQFALVSGEQVLLAREQGLPVVYVLAWYQDYPIAVVSSPEAGIQSPSDLRGKKIALPGLFGASYVGLRALLNEAGIPESDVTLSSIGFNQVPAFASDQEDIVVGYTSNEPIQLGSQGYAVNVLRVADFVELASNGLITNEETLESDPDLARRFVAAILHGLADTIDNPQEAFEISKNYIDGFDQSDPAVQREVLDVSIEFWRTDTPGVSDPIAWENMQQVLLDMGLLQSTLELNEAFTNDYLP